MTIPSARRAPLALGLLLFVALAAGIPASAQDPQPAQPQPAQPQPAQPQPAQPQPAQPQPAQPQPAQPQPAQPQPKDEPVSLRYVFTAGAERKLTVVDRQSDRTTERGRELVHTRSTTTYFREKITKVGEDGTGTLTLTYTRVTHTQTSTLFPETLRFDSDKAEDIQRAQKDIALRPFAALVGLTVTLTVTPTGAVTAVSGFEPLLTRLFKDLDDPRYQAFKGAMRAQLSDAAMRAKFEGLYRVLPDAPVKVGDTWTRKQTVPVTFVGDLQVARTFTLEALRKDGKRDVAVIRVEAKTTSKEAAGAGVGAGIPGTDVLPDITIRGRFDDGSLKGLIVFDRTPGITDKPATGRVVRQLLAETLDLTLTGQTAQGQTLDSRAAVTERIAMAEGTPLPVPARAGGPWPAIEHLELAEPEPDDRGGADEPINPTNPGGENAPANPGGENAPANPGGENAPANPGGENAPANPGG